MFYHLGIVEFRPSQRQHHFMQYLSLRLPPAMSIVPPTTSPTISTMSPTSCGSNDCLTPSSVASSESISPRNHDDCEFDNSSRDDSLHSSTSDDHPKKTSSRSSRARRTSFYAYQLTGLGQVFEKEQYPDPAQRQKIAEALDLDFDTVTRWFQNRRAKFRRDSINRQRRSSARCADTVQKKGSGLSSFTMESILRKSPSTTNNSSGTLPYGSQASPQHAAVNSYYQHYPYFYPAYVYHYYPNVQAHNHSPISTATEKPIPLSPDKPLDLSFAKKRDLPAKENDVPSPKKKKGDQRNNSNKALDLSSSGEADDIEPKTTREENGNILYSKFNSVYAPGYYRPYPYRVMNTPDARNSAHDGGYVPMTSIPVNSLYGQQNYPAALPFYQ
ncbi:uncharacterized protein [Ptychodera flava]|uniref:uncharacterized protein n=1 Tax=Ptychodera flava TaxID=63121 RepID=UPI00396A23F9